MAIGIVKDLSEVVLRDSLRYFRGGYMDSQRSIRCTG